MAASGAGAGAGTIMLGGTGPVGGLGSVPGRRCGTTACVRARCRRRAAHACVSTQQPHACACACLSPPGCRGVCVDLRRMNRVLAVAVEDMDCRVQVRGRGGPGDHSPAPTAPDHGMRPCNRTWLPSPVLLPQLARNQPPPPSVAPALNQPPSPASPPPHCIPRLGSDCLALGTCPISSASDT